jgi:pilus assembly protein CpaF
MRFSFNRSSGNGHGAEPAIAGPEPLSRPLPVEAPNVDAPRPAGNGLLQRPELIDAKVRLHRKLIDELNLSQIDKLSRPELRQQVHKLVSEYVLAERIPLNQRELGDFVEEVMDELTGLGPIEPFLKDPTVTDILINTHEKVFVERFGQLEQAEVRFKDEAHVLRIVNKIVGAVGRRVDESQPMVDARLLDGSRINVAVRPIAVDGPLVSIRKFGTRPFDMESLIKVGTLSQPMAQVLSEAVRARLSIVISGGTGTGKTTFLNALSRSISHKERLITIEDAAELQLQQPHVGRLETRPPTIEGRGEIRQRELVKNALRMRPDRIIVGEVRGEEAFDMLQAMTTGHEGSMTTIHANSPRDAVARLEQMVGMAGFAMTELSIRMHIASAVKIIVQLQRFPDGKRRLISISEVTGVDAGVVQMQEIFRFVRTPSRDESVITGEFRATGLRPTFLDILRQNGASISDRALHPGWKQ